VLEEFYILKQKSPTLFSPYTGKTFISPCIQHCIPDKTKSNVQ